MGRLIRPSRRSWAGQPSLPRETSEGFSADLTPHLLGLAEEAGPSGPWRAAPTPFDQVIGQLEAPEGS